MTAFTTDKMLDALDAVGLNADIVDDGENDPYLRIDGSKFSVVILGGISDEEVNLNLVSAAERSNYVEPWKGYDMTMEFMDLSDLDEFIEATLSTLGE